MFFEGAEKKVELSFKYLDQSLLSFDDIFWENCVEFSKAKILSKVSNEKCKAFLLSESSLFVWDDRLLMITCGKTTLIKSIEYLGSKIGAKYFDQIFYQRKNELRSHEQLTSFDDDVKVLRNHIDGKVAFFGRGHTHHNFLYFSQAGETKTFDKTTELLMYDLNIDVCSKLCHELKNKQDIFNFLNLDHLFKDFIVDDHCFKPFGYSLNAIKDEQYYTIHITPESSHSYLSFETNADLTQAPEVLKHWLDLAQPESFDLMSFNGLKGVELDNYWARMKFMDKLNCGHEVSFESFFQNNFAVLKPTFIS